VAPTAKGEVTVHYSAVSNRADEVLLEWLVDEGFKDRPNRTRILKNAGMSCGIYAD
jgi:hypothetical protein